MSSAKKVSEIELVPFNDGEVSIFESSIAAPLDNAMGTLSPHKLGATVLGFVVPTGVTRILAVALAHQPADATKKPLLGKAINPALTKTVATLGALAAHVYGGKKAMTLGWLVGEILDLTRYAFQFLDAKVESALGEGTLNGVIGSRYGFETGGIFGRQYGFEQGDVAPSDIAALKQLRSQLRGVQSESSRVPRASMTYPQ